MTTEATRSRRTAPRRPSAQVLTDAAAVAALTGIGLSAFAGTFEGWWWVLTSAVGVLVGLALALVPRRVPWWATVPALPVALALLAPPLTMRGTEAGPVPGPASWAQLVRTLRDGWMGLLTTLPPLDGAGPLTVVPLLLGLVGAWGGMLLAVRTTRPHLPLVPPVLVGVLAVLLGVQVPGGVVGRALAALAVGVPWGATRRRRSVTVHDGSRWRSLVAGTALLGVVGVVTVLAAPAVVGTDTRQVLRTHVTPPQDLADRPSPLAAFRAFRPVAEDLADAELLRVDGLPSGQVLRLATLDSYTGTVWSAGTGLPGPDETAPGASGAFLRVGARIPQPEGGRDVTVRVTVGQAWADDRDLRMWVPTLGHDTRLEFTGDDARQRAEDLRYNLGTGAAVVRDGLAPGDSYLLEGRLDAGTDPDLPPPDGSSVDPELSQVTAGLVAASGGAGEDPVDQVASVADRLRSTGAYSDGGEGEQTILPGHGLGRLASFLEGTQPAGNDEQYAATLALAAEYLGVPSRVVLGAVPGPDGVVTGTDVRAWVEVRGADGWRLIGPDEFVPDRDTRPRPRAVVERDRSEAAIVPPPNALRPPSSEDGFSLDESASGRSRTAAPEEPFTLPLWAAVTLVAAGGPLGLLLLWTLLLVAAKAVRRQVRSRRGSPSQRASAAWDEVVDGLRDAGYPVSDRHSRGEVAQLAEGRAVIDAARVADELSYGPAPLDDDAADRMWSLATRARQERAAGLGPRARWRAAVTLASWLRRDVDPARIPSAIQRDRVAPPRAGGPVGPPGGGGGDGAELSAAGVAGRDGGAARR